MRTTLTIDDDIMAAARDLADYHKKNVGEVISGLARKGLMPSQPIPETRNGVPQFPIRPDSKPVTLEIVNKLRDELL